MGRERPRLHLILGGEAPVPQHLLRPSVPVSTAEIEHLKARMGNLEIACYRLLHEQKWTELAITTAELDRMDTALKACLALAGIEG